MYVDRRREVFVGEEVGNSITIPIEQSDNVVVSCIVGSCYLVFVTYKSMFKLTSSSSSESSFTVSSLPKWSTSISGSWIISGIGDGFLIREMWIMRYRRRSGGMRSLKVLLIE